MGVWGFDGKAKRAQHRLGIILKINVREMVRLAWNEFVLLL